MRAAHLRGSDRDVRHLLPGAIQQGGRRLGCLGAYAVDIEADQQAFGARELAPGDRHGVRIGGRRLELAWRPAAIDTRRADRRLRGRQIRYVDGADLLIQGAAGAGLVHGEAEFHLPGRRVEDDPLWGRRRGGHGHGAWRPC